MSTLRNSKNAISNSAPLDALDAIALIVSKITGVQLGANQRAMVESRLRRRLGPTGCADIDEYRRYIEKNQLTEVPVLVSLLTTHHTFFFREFNQFEYLAQTALPKLIEIARKRGDKTIRVWSAACSRGQEVYSLSMMFNFYLKKMAPDVSYRILGTDVDPHSVEIASNGVYSRNETKEIPVHFSADHWARGTGEISDYVKAKASIRAACRFEVSNLIELSKPTPEKFDVIFCRNVFIYFTPLQVKNIASYLIGQLTPNGNLFVGCSETLSGMALPVSSLGPSIYAHKEEKTSNVIKMPKRTSLQASRILRVMCVDDSLSIQALLKQILKKDAGFEIVATATNGIEAAKKLKEQPVDVMTLDIHMPEQNGLDYLKASFGPNHPPVVMLTSVSREDSDLAYRAFDLGALDYVEKPTLTNLTERGEEIRTKLRCAVQNHGIKADLSIDREFQAAKRITNPQDKFRGLVATISDRPKLKMFFNELKGDQPPTYIFMEGADSALQAFKKKLQGEISSSFTILLEPPKSPTPNQIYLLDFSKQFEPLTSNLKKATSVVLVFGTVSKHAVAKLSSWKNGSLILEDVADAPSQLKSNASDILPWTSFAYVSCDLLEKAKS